MQEHWGALLRHSPVHFCTAVAWYGSNTLICSNLSNAMAHALLVAFADAQEGRLPPYPGPVPGVMACPHIVHASEHATILHVSLHEEPALLCIYGTHIAWTSIGAGMDDPRPLPGMARRAAESLVSGGFCWN
jgi:hypothetical protein